MFKITFVSLFILFTSTAIAETIVIGGSGTDLATFKLLANKFHELNPSINVKLLPSIGSGGGIKAVGKGKIALCLMSRAPKNKEKTEGLIFKHYAQTPFVFSTHKDAEVDNLTTQNILDIYSGKMTHWSDGYQIKPILRPSKDSDITILVNNFKDFDKIINRAYQRRGFPIALTDQEAAQQIATIQGAIGTTTLALIKTEDKPIKAIKHNGIEPSPENIKSGHYKLYKDLYLCYDKNKSTDSLKRFVSFVNSNGGRTILQKTGHRIIQP